MGDAVTKAIGQTTLNNANEARFLNFMGGLTDMASTIPGVGPGFTMMSAAFTIDSALLPGSTPSPLLDNVTVTQDTAGPALAAALVSADEQLSTYGNFAVADPALLEQMDAYFNSHDPNTTSTSSPFVIGSADAAQQWLWGTILASAYSEWTAPSTYGISPACNIETSHGMWVGQPWQNLDAATGSWQSITNSATGLTPTNWLIGLGVSGDLPVASKVSGLPPAISKPVFAPVDPTTMPTTTSGAGAIQPYFGLNYLPINAVKQFPPGNGWPLKYEGPPGCYAPQS